MKIIFTLLLVTWSANVGSGEEVRIAPQPRVRLDPVTRAAVAAVAAQVAEVAAQAVKGAEAEAQAAKEANALKEAGDASPILLGKFVVREQGTGPREAPKQETFEGRFTPWKGGRLWAGKLGGTNAEVGFWPYLEFTKVASTAMREGGPRLNVDLLRMKW